MKFLFYLVIFMAGWFGAVVFDSHNPVVCAARLDAYQKQMLYQEKLAGRSLDTLSVFAGVQVPETFEITSIDVVATAYTAVPEECNAEPWITADGTPSRVGLLAVSRDLLEDEIVAYGDKVAVSVDGQPLGVFRVSDTMNERFKRRIDLLHADKKSARMFGIKHATIHVLTDGGE